VTPIPELWSDRDRQDGERLVRAIGEGDLLGALLAIEGATPEAEAAAIEWIDERAEAVRAHAPGAGPLDALAQALVRDGGLAGDGADYYHPDNNRLTRVIARRTGQPILIACVWIEVGRRAGLEVFGLPLPGHFLVGLRIEPDGALRAIDVFQGGPVLSPEQCAEIARRAAPGRAFEAAWLEPAGVDAIAQRVLRNLAHAHREADDAAGVYRALRLLARITPEARAVHLELAVLTEQHGAWPEALTMYRDIVQRFAESREARVAELKLVELEARTRTLN